MDVGDPTGLSARPGFDRSERRFAVGATALTVGLAMGSFTPVLYHMVLHWKRVPDYSHGFLGAPLAAYFAWERRDAFARARTESFRIFDAALDDPAVLGDH